MSKTNIINSILKPTNFVCRREYGKFKIERLKNDGIFISDITYCKSFAEALKTATAIANCY